MIVHRTTKFLFLLAQAEISCPVAKGCWLRIATRGVGAGGGYPLLLVGVWGGGGVPRKILKIKMPNPAFWLYFFANFSHKNYT
jgi:hypothetical protein